ncbi:MAG: hypothetical protein QXR53_01795 [Candidatus Norongarragalinales archaeon]
MLQALFPNFVLFGGFFEIFETLGELDFVIRVMVFSYILFWLYTTFMPARADLLFGIGGIIAGYLIFAHGVSITLIVAFFVLFIVGGMMIQQVLMFGLLPLLGYQYVGDRFMKANELHGSPSNAEALAKQYYSPGMAMLGSRMVEQEQQQR